jgi:hypothetical protein
VPRSSRARPLKVGLILFTSVTAVLALTLGAAASHRAAPHRTQASSSLPCNTGGPECLNIGFTDAWLNGETVQLEFSHTYFCVEPPSSGATSHCEAGEAAITAPPNLVVSELYVVVPMGFTPPASTIQCGTRCIDMPTTMDLSRIGGDSNATVGPKSFVIEEDESFQSTWWPVVVVGVKTLNAWNRIATTKSIDTVDACQANGHCAPEAETNAYAFFQVLGPGMSPQGPA